MALILNGDTGITYPVATATGSATQASAGRVLQVVSSQSTSSYSTSSASFVASGLSISITPSSSTSKVLILARIAVSFPSNTSGGAGGGIALYRGSTALYTPQNYEWYLNVNTIAPRGTQTINYLDSPASTSSVTYNFYFASYNGNGLFYINDASQSGLTLQEISA